MTKRNISNPTTNNNIIPRFLMDQLTDPSEHLEWYYNYADGDMGDKSNFGSMISVMHGYDPNNGYSEHVLHAAHRKELIHKALQKIPIEQYNILYAHYGYTMRVPKNIVQVFNQYAIVVLSLYPIEVIEKAITNKKQANNILIETKEKIDFALIHFKNNLKE
jgi:hypothetical protein